MLLKKITGLTYTGRSWLINLDNLVTEKYAAIIHSMIKMYGKAICTKKINNCIYLNNNRFKILYCNKKIYYIDLHE